MRPTTCQRWLFCAVLVAIALPGVVHLLGATDARAAAAGGQRPNFLIILIDDMGWRDLTCQGSSYFQTPQIDRLAREGMRFTQAYAACNVCSPTRASIMSGRYPARLHLTNFIAGRRVPENSPVLPPDYRLYLELEETTIAEALKPCGYVCGSFGKWHLGNIPTHGPDKQGFDVFDARMPRSKDDPKGTKDPKGIAGLTEQAVQFLQTNQDRPFFLYLCHFAVHIPLEAKPELVTKYELRRKPGDVQQNAIYAAMIESLDEGVGKVLSKLDELKIADRTVVIFTSDNGGLSVREGPNTPATSNAPLRAGKGWLYEGGHRVPLLVRWPGEVKAGSLCDVPVCSIDFLPTIVELAGAKPAADRPPDGVSLVPLLRQRGPIQREALYWHYPHFSNQGGMPGGAVRQGDFKLIEFYHDNHVELYNLKDDPGETKDLAQQLPQQAGQLRKMLDQWRKSVDAQPMPRNPKYDPSQPTNYSVGP